MLIHLFSKCHRYSIIMSKLKTFSIIEYVVSAQCNDFKYKLNIQKTQN